MGVPGNSAMVNTDLSPLWGPPQNFCVYRWTVLSNVGGAIGHVSTFRASLGYGGWKEPQHAHRSDQVPWAWDGFVRGAVTHGMITMRWKLACWQWWWWEGAAGERSTEVDARGSKTRVPPAGPWEQEEPLSVAWSPDPTLILSNPKLLTPFCSAPSLSFRVLSKVFPFPNSATSLRPQTFISSFVKGTEMKLMWPNGCWTGLSVPLF